MAGPVVGNRIDLIESSGADLAPPGTTRIIRKGGVTVQSVDGGAFSTIAGGGAPSWRQAMFAFAVAKYPTISKELLVDFLAGLAGDYAATTNNNGAVNVNTSVTGGVVTLDTGASTLANTNAAVTPKGGPALCGNTLTGAPWFFATRARANVVVTATDQMLMCGPSTAPTPISLSNPFFGMDGTASTGFLVLHASNSTKVITTVAIDTTLFHDFALGFDGTTLTAYYGNVLAGTLVSVATSTDLTSLQSSPGQPECYLFAGATTRLTADVDAIYGAVATP